MSQTHDPCDSFTDVADWGSFYPPFIPDPLHTYHFCLTVIPLTDNYLLPPSPHVYRPQFFWCCFVVTTIFDCTVSFWALCASGNTTFINNSFCQNLALFFFSSLFSLNEPHFPFQFLRLLSGLSFALPFQLPRYFTVFFFFLFWQLLQNCPMLCHVESKKEVKIQLL